MKFSIKYFIPTSLLLLLPLFLSAQCVEGDCKNGRGTFKYSGGAKYTGTFKNYKRHGQGTCYYKNGGKYVGFWNLGFPEGKGAKYLEDGSKLSGVWRKGKLINPDAATIAAAKPPTPKPNIEEKEEVIAHNPKPAPTTTAETSHQKGCVSGNCSSGIGIYVFPNGGRYEGNFANGQINGGGTMYFPSGTVQAGFWNNGKYNGLNILNKNLVKNCNKKYCGNGWGYYTYLGGDVYAGQFQDGDPNGIGSCRYRDGNRYVGEWSNHAPNGEGIMYFKNGVTIEGYWENARYVGVIPQMANNNAPTKEGDFFYYEPVEFDPEVKVWAVIVGIGRYTHMPSLKYTDDDAYEFYAFLKSPEGGALTDYQIKKVIDEDATRANIIRVMSETFSKADSNDVVMMYFSGHGLQGSFIPIDFDGQNNKLTHTDIKKVLERSRAKHKICIADACHSGSLMASRGSVSQTLTKYYDAFKSVKGGTALLMSSKSEETSLESNGLRQGVFSHYLIKGLKGEADANRNKIVTINELYKYIHKNVQKYTLKAQTPTISGDYDYNMPIGVIR